jgi:hypothetical protein
MSLIKDLLFNKDNQSLDIARLSAAIVTVFFVGLATAKFVNNRDIDLVEFATAWGLICAGSGGWIYLRQQQENK